MVTSYLPNHSVKASLYKSYIYINYTYCTVDSHHNLHYTVFNLTCTCIVINHSHPVIILTSSTVFRFRVTQTTTSDPVM